MLTDDAAVLAAIREAALRLLAYRPRSEAEIRRRLVDRFPEHLVDRIVQRLTEQRLLDDAAFAGQWRENREQHRPRARSMVRQELRRLGVATEVVDQALEGFDDAANAYRAGYRLGRRLAKGPEPDFLKRVTAHLLRRGFGYTLSAGTAARLRAELADPLHRHEDSNDDNQQSPGVKDKGLEN